MSADSLPIAGGLAYREAGPAGAPVVLCVHGWPESSWMWRHALEALSAAGLRAIAPDLPGYGASPVHRPATWALHREAVEGFRQALGLQRVGLAVHDWGGLIGLRWACDHPDAIAALAISDTGFFADGKWHGFAQMMRTEGQGEDLMRTLDREAFGAVLQASSKGMTPADVDEYFQALATEEGRLAALDLYRSGEFSELEPYQGKLAALGVPTLVLWGEDDPFAPIAGAHRLVDEIPHARLQVIPDTGHFVAEDAPEQFATALAEFFTEALA